ncbi:N-acetylmuramoyl-L-alanine amidase [Natronincola peptidivorans]|uniref:N-acetylmuramoyl-L-alanine amidase n=1 Tax=Natronincola peptidivorans TaxID=426128 RepID=A0A1I0FV07_9FIRM|nr:cell wall hydrolase [Natronincola peptidivorans]SET62350.1 N-acetylmuramoyl-L-alanine amidase [Natronincola peptidivorans]
MKLQWNKLSISVLIMTLVLIVFASVQIANTPSTVIQGTAMEVEEDLHDDEEIAGEIQEDQEEYLFEEDELQEDTNAMITEENKASSVTTDVASENIHEANNSVNNQQKTAVTVDRSPITGERYTVKAGDTLFLVAERAKLSLTELKNINNIHNDTIYVGQVLQTKSTPQARNVAAVTPSQPVSRGGQREDDIYWLSRIIHAEAQGEPYQGKVAVGNVVLNRVRSSKFPNTIYGVIFDRQEGFIQFSPVIDGTIYNTPNRDSIQAATEALNGVRPVGDALYFLNPRKATNFWIVGNRKYMLTIGDHDFYY